MPVKTYGRWLHMVSGLKQNMNTTQLQKYDNHNEIHDLHNIQNPAEQHHVFSAAFFSLSDIRSGASLFVLNLPLPSAAVSTFFLTI